MQSNYDLQVDIGKRIFLEYDQDLLIRKFRLDADDDYLYLTYLGSACRIDRKTGSIEEQVGCGWQECRSFGTVMTIYDLLCYHKGDAPPPLSGQWCTAGTFVVTGVTKTEVFTKKYTGLFDGQPEKLKDLCEKLGGTVLPPLAGADVTCRFPVTDFFPVLLQFWQSDEDFPAKLMLLWDRNSDQFLHFETTFYLQGDLLSRLKKLMEKRSTNNGEA